jgi:5'(3')-deoxyribonucleotidase
MTTTEDLIYSINAGLYRIAVTSVDNDLLHKIDEYVHTCVELTAEVAKSTGYRRELSVTEYADELYGSLIDNTWLEEDARK